MSKIDDFETTVEKTRYKMLKFKDDYEFYSS
jgi:hypothetical protein